MNKKSTTYRILKAIASVPFPQDGTGTKTISMSGMKDYVDDMKNIVRFLNSIIFSIQDGEKIDEHDVLSIEKIARGEW